MNKEICKLMDADELLEFQEAVSNTARQFSDIIGVLAVGSLVQSSEIPADFFTPRYITVLGLAYEQIRNPGRRRLGIREGSDLDIWICTRDTGSARAARDQVELGAVALLSELASGTLKWGSTHWHNKKKTVFGQYYKNPELYSQDFVTANKKHLPWMGQGFKELLETYVIEHMPQLVEKVNRRFEKQVPGSFFEVRAFPESLFHLRPDDTLMPTMLEDRMPFPRIANDQWISPEHSSLILYASEDVRIYPFKLDGYILGSRIAEYLAGEDALSTGEAYGSLVIKPDAIRKDQLGIIVSKIQSDIRSFNGRIVLQKTLKTVTAIDVETMYPLLKGRELREVKDSLVGGEMIILVIASNLPSGELFKRISDIKGPRLIDRSHERLMEGRILDGSLRDLLPVPGEEDLYRKIVPTILAKKANPSIRFSDEEYKYYAQNLVHSPDNEIEIRGLLELVGFRRK